MWLVLDGDEHRGNLVGEEERIAHMIQSDVWKCQERGVGIPRKASSTPQGRVRLL